MWCHNWQLSPASASVGGTSIVHRTAQTSPLNDGNTRILDILAWYLYSGRKPSPSLFTVYGGQECATYTLIEHELKSSGQALHRVHLITIRINFIGQVCVCTRGISLPFFLFLTRLNPISKQSQRHTNTLKNVLTSPHTLLYNVQPSSQAFK